MKNKILFVTNKAPHYRIPLYNELAKKLNIKFILTHESGRVNGLEADYENVSGIGKGKFKIHFALTKILKKEKPDRVVFLPPDPLHLFDDLILHRYCKKNKIPYTLPVGRWEYKSKPLKQRATEQSYIKILKGADKLVVYGTKSEEWLIVRGVDKKKIVKAYNINPDIYGNFHYKPKGKFKWGDKKFILFVGRLLKVKGIDYLIKAFSEFKQKNYSLTLVGGGDFYKLGAKSEEHRLKELVKKLNLNEKIIFSGALKPEETKDYYSHASLFVLPSITYGFGEAWGHVIEEAMSFGLPVVATDAVGAAYDLIEDGKNGFIVPEKDSEKLKGAIEKVLNNEKLRAQMGAESLKVIKQKKFSFEEIVKKWMEGLRL